MKLVIDYLNKELESLNTTLLKKESLLNSMIIESNEIHKTIIKLTSNENDTFSIFNASGSKIDFTNKEVIDLKSKERNFKVDMDELGEEIKSINKAIEEIAIVIAHANESNKKISKLSDENIRLNGELAMYVTGGKVYSSKINEDVVDEPLDVFKVKDTDVVEEEKLVLSPNVEVLNINEDKDKFLEDIANKVFFLGKILKFDPVRTKLELDEMYKSIKKFINK